MCRILALLLLIGATSANADNCSMTLAKKYAQSAIDVTILDQPETYVRSQGRLVFKQSESLEYTAEYLSRQIAISEDPYQTEYQNLLNELQNAPGRHIFRTRHVWEAGRNYRLAFNFLIKLDENRGNCSLLEIRKK